jgi:hypothetical protein
MNRLWVGAFVGFLCVSLLAGCGPAKFDASNASAAGKSFQSMTADMTEAQRQEFMGRATAVPSLLRMKAGDTSTPTADSMWKGIHGMTKVEIEAKANELLPTKTPAPAK